VDPVVQARAEEAASRHELALRSQARDLVGEQQRARGKYAGDPRGLRAAFARLDEWDARKRAAIERDYAYRREVILADRFRSPECDDATTRARARRLALAEATRNRELREIDADHQAELRRAHGRYHGTSLGDAKERLIAHFAVKRAQTEVRYFAARVRILSS
jgi:hypothetical protein